MVQVKGKGMKWWNWEERKAVTNHVTINRKMSNGDSLGTWRIPITHLKDTHQIPLRYPIVYWPIAPSRSSFSLIASIIYELKSRDVLLVALSSAWASNYDSGMALRFLAFVLAATGRPETSSAPSFGWDGAVAVTAEEEVCNLAESTRFFSFSACALNFTLLMR